MSDLMLKKFQAWAVIDNRYSIDRTYTDLRYDEDDTEAAWNAWQASRECLVIELPRSIEAYGPNGYQSSDPDEALLLEDVHAALTAAGVKYK